MRLSSQLTMQYPKLAKWITINIPKVIDKSQVFYAFMKYSELSHARVVNVLTTNSLPIIVPWYFAKNHDGLNKTQINGRSNWVSQGYSRNLIFLAKIICEKFENSEKSAKDPRMHMLLESTILHEMVHWGDALDGTRQKGEEGKMFEKAAYDGQIGRYWREI